MAIVSWWLSAAVALFSLDEEEEEEETEDELLPMQLELAPFALFVFELIIEMVGFVEAEEVFVFVFVLFVVKDEEEDDEEEEEAGVDAEAAFGAATVTSFCVEP